MDTIKLDLRDLSHLRSLSDALVACPEKAASLLKITVRTATPTKDGSLDQILMYLKKEEGRLESREGIESLAQELKESKERLFQRAGEILNRALILAKRSGRRRRRRL